MSRGPELELSTATARDANSGGDSGVLQLLALETTGFKVISLPPSGSLRIGRGDECELRLEDALVSRRHAILRLNPLSIEDLGSANGTRLGSTVLPAATPTSLPLGQAISVGRSLVLVRRAAAPATADATGEKAHVTQHANLVVRDPTMRKLYATVERLARGRISVLILGETGVGKEVVAEAIHRASPRRDARFLRVNCASLSESLLESDLFGHERGAFTGASSTKPGLIELADGGTVLLDEVGELPLALQAKLLRLLETRETIRVGGLHSRCVDVRFLFATNRPLELDVRAGTFRADLFFRLSGAVLNVPPLRERPAEIVPLAEAAIARAAEQLHQHGSPTLTEDARRALREHPWPGNVRELRNCIERAVLLCSSASITALDLDLQSGSAAVDMVPHAGPRTAPPLANVDPERERIEQALLECGGNQRRAAESLGVSRRTLVRKLAVLGLPRPRRAG